MDLRPGGKSFSNPIKLTGQHSKRFHLVWRNARAGWPQSPSTRFQLARRLDVRFFRSPGRPLPRLDDANAPKLSASVFRAVASRVLAKCFLLPKVCEAVSTCVDISQAADVHRPSRSLPQTATRAVRSPPSVPAPVQEEAWPGV
ncbi:hypothetical protein SKAU_G00413930 [Synaphobranchus kaupii]|uniref:Uncharacterized protein n=1 Tax=Synaphobranchus kaupii TaxID=118154 RepID=A0A9Q1E750_SYNKA|nr:hypothetical protein SKAU_G00413930 [Synaphobranchus kaupii]